MMKWQDPSIQPILCGSSNDRMPTYPEWDRVALETCWEQVDYLSMHYYAGNRENDTASYLASAGHSRTSSTRWRRRCATSRPSALSKHDVYLSWDEWNVWYKGDPTARRLDRSAAPGRRDLQPGGRAGRGPVAERLPAQEPTCSRSPAWRRSSTSSPGCRPDGDGLLKQTSFYPFKLVSHHARGHALDVLVQAPVIETKPVRRHAGAGRFGQLRRGHRRGRGLHRQPQPGGRGAHRADLAGRPAGDASAAWQLAGTDVKAANTWENPDQITARQIQTPKIADGKAIVQLPPLSFTVVTTQAR